MVDMGSTACDGMYSKLIDKDSQYLDDSELRGHEVHAGKNIKKCLLYQKNYLGKLYK